MALILNVAKANFRTIIRRLLIFGFPLPVFKIMADTTVCIKMEQLIKRLNEAERRATLLNREVKNIKQEIALLKDSVNTVTHSSTRSITTSSANDGLDGPQLENKRFKSSFKEENGYVVVYTDGACENNGKINAKAGFGVWFGHNHPLNISKPVKGKATNNAVEIQACIEALKVLDSEGVPKVKIHTDSQFTINCMTEWITRWKKNNWKTTSTTSQAPVKNKEDLQKLDDLVNKFQDVSWVYVPGHREIEGNEEADKLAREGALRYKEICNLNI